MLRTLGTFALLCSAAFSSFAMARGADTLVADNRLSVADQQRLARSAIDGCAKRGVYIAVAIAGPDRAVRTLLSHDRVSPVAIEAARRKAITAALVGRPSAGLTRAAIDAPAYVEFMRSVEPQLVMIGGGLPIRVEGQLVGAIGVGGGPGPEADEACAAQAMTAEKLDGK